MHDLNDLFFYVQAVDHGGFAPAGRALGVPKSRISRRVAALEERLGVRLIQRTTRQFNITEIGQRYYKHCKAMLVEAEAAEEVVEAMHAEPCGTLRITCPITLLNVHVGQMLADFMSTYTSVTIHLEATNRRVDVVAEGVDVAIRVRPRPLEDSDLILRVLSDRGQCLLASPALVERLGMPKAPDDLARFPSLARGIPEETFEWFLSGSDGEELVQAYKPRLITTDMLALQQAALAGVGIVQLPRLMVQKDLANGSLIDLLPNWEPRREMIHAVFPSRRGLLPSVRLLVDHLAERYASFEED